MLTFAPRQLLRGGEAPRITAGYLWQRTG